MAIVIMLCNNLWGKIIYMYQAVRENICLVY
jgi:hypothetical protein